VALERWILFRHRAEHTPVGFSRNLRERACTRDDRARCFCGEIISNASSVAHIKIAHRGIDWQIQLVPRIRGSHPAPILEREKPTPTNTDREVLMSMHFIDDKCLTEGRMNRRTFERLEEVGWIKGIESNACADVTYD
jgi:hypothetical protein